MDLAAGKAGVREVDRYVVKYAYRFEGLTRSSNKSEAKDSTLARKAAIEYTFARTGNRHRWVRRDS